MKVRELMELLAKMPPDAPVYFDTEAQKYDVHLVSIDRACCEPDSITGCGDTVTLHEDAQHRSGR